MYTSNLYNNRLVNSNQLCIVKNITKGYAIINQLSNKCW